MPKLLSPLHIAYEEDCDKAQKYFDKALAIMRKEGMIITVKDHGSESHMVHHMRTVEGGLFELDEYWGEQYCQIGHAYNVRMRKQHSELIKAKSRAEENRRVCLPETQEVFQKLHNSKKVREKELLRMR